MKSLFFHAVARHRNVVPALMGHARSVLWPFDRYLAQAIHTAKDRQTRYQLQWERVRERRSYRLHAVDTLLRVPRQEPGAVLTDWPSDRTPDLSQVGFLPARGQTVAFVEARHGPTGLVVRTEPPLEQGDRVIWCEVTSAVTLERAPAPPRELLDARGRRLVLRGPPEVDPSQRHWRLWIEGKVDPGELSIDGRVVEAQELPPFEALQRVSDEGGNTFEVRDGRIRADVPPGEGLLRSVHGARYRSEPEGGARQGGCWVQLLTTQDEGADETIDPRAAFCEGDVAEVWTQPRFRANDAYKVKRVDQDRYQLLLDRYPPEGSTLYLPVNVRNLHLQRRALRQLSEAPLPHHEGLLRLCEAPGHVRWPPMAPRELPAGDWRALTDASRSGTEQQRAFVRKALATPDLALLEGPPGSGKTTAICELVQQLVEAGERVLLCASTHVAIDNVLERLLESAAPIDAVRVGKLGRVDDAVQSSQLDCRVKELLEAWRGRPGLSELPQTDLEAMAERTVVMASNLTCGTTMGIVSHPLFRGRDADMHIAKRPISTMPHWDVLIIDEASKTLIQEFMVPAMMAKRWIVVGDVHQLPPFTERADLVANLRDLRGSGEAALFPREHQRACLLLFRLLRQDLKQRGLRWLLVEPPAVLSWVGRELAADPVPSLSAVRVVAEAGQAGDGVEEVTLAQLRDGAAEALHLLGADWVLVAEDLIAEVSPLLPANLLLANTLDGESRPLHASDPLLHRQAWWVSQTRRLARPYRERGARVSSLTEAQALESRWLGEHDLAHEMAWRLTRVHELKRSRNDALVARLRDDLAYLQPRAVDIAGSLAEIEDIGLPSILEVVQEGIGVERATRHSALTGGLQNTAPDPFSARFESLSFQHRMHADIAAFPRDVIYGGSALQDANTIAQRDARLGWDFGLLPARRAWAHVDGRETGRVNEDEVKAMAGLIRQFAAWAKAKGPPNRGLPELWEVACLSFYTKQDEAVSRMLKKLTGDDRRTRFKVPGAPVEIVCGTVDRFQGREADLVLLSMRNTSRVGFLDSPNRLNVAVTRARQQLVVFGNRAYFARCQVSELSQLARLSPEVDADLVRGWKKECR